MPPPLAGTQKLAAAPRYRRNIFGCSRRDLIKMSQKRCTQRVSAEGACSDTPVGSKANVHVHVPGPEGAGEVARGTDNVCRLQEERWKGNGTGERSTLTCMAGVAALLIRCFETGLLTRISALEKSAHSCYFTRLKPPRFLVRFFFLQSGYFM